MRPAWMAVLFAAAHAGPGWAAGPRLSPAPWSDGEVLWLATQPDDSTSTTRPALPPPSGGVRPGGTRLQVVTAGEAGRWVWRTYSFAMSWSAGSAPFGVTRWSADLRSLEVDGEDMAPRTLLMSGWGRETRVLYGAGRAEAVDGDRMVDLEAQGAVFEASELPLVLRRLPLEDGYSVSFTVLGGSAYPVKVEVVGRETVSVPAGTFECFRIEVTGRGPQPRRSWISTDRHRYPVKDVEERGSVTELAKITRWDQPTPLAFEDEHWKVSATAPPGWVWQVPTSPPSPLSFSASVWSADAAAVCTLWLDDFLLLLKDRPAQPPVGWRPESPRRFAERSLKGRSRLFPTYAVRAESWTESTIDGFPAVRVAADFVFDRRPEEDLVEYARYSNQPFRAVLSCLAPKAAFEKRKPEIDALLDSLRLR